MFQFNIKNIAFAVVFVSLIFIESCGCASVIGRQDRNVASRIYGGNTAPYAAFPFQVSLRSTDNHHFCGGALISETYALTAASCVYDRKPTETKIIVGADSIQNGQIMDCENITTHERFDSKTLANDIAVVQTTREVEFRRTVASISYYKFTASCNVDSVTTGFGDTEKGPAFQLQYLNMTTITNRGCETFLSDYPDASEIEFSASTLDKTCALGKFNTGSSLCGSDKGGPLFRPLSNILFGILSFSACDNKVPGIFTLTGYHADWILSQTGVEGSTIY